MNDYTILNITNNKRIIIIKDYELKIKDLINIVNLKNIDEIIFVIDYLPENNKFRSISFSVVNDKIDLNKYSYLNNDKVSQYINSAFNQKTINC